MERPIPYKGDQPYIFISYAHKDSSLVWPIVDRMQKDGYRVWYDEGIDPGTEWDENIAAHVTGCSFFIAFLSENYLASDNCKDELNFARDQGKQRILVYLEDVELPQGMAMRLGRSQAIFHNRYADREKFFEKLYEAQGIEAFGPGIAPAKPSEPARVETVSQAQKKRKKGLPLWLIPVAVVAVAIVAVAVLLGGGKEPGGQPSGNQSVELEGEVLLDTEEFTISLVGDASDSRYFGLSVVVENKTRREISVSLEDTYLNGVLCDPNWYCYVEGKSTAQDTIQWTWDALKQMGIEEVTVVESLVMGYYTDDYSDLPERTMTCYPQGEEQAQYVQYVPGEGDLVLVDDEAYLVVVTGMGYASDNDFLLDLVVVNRSDRPSGFVMEDCFVNNYAMDPTWSLQLEAGKTAYTQMKWEEWTLTGQESVLVVEGKLEIYDRETYDTWMLQRVLLYPEGEETAVLTPWEMDADDITVLENDFVRVVLTDVVEGSNDWCLYFYVSSQSNEPIYVTLKDVNIGGQNASTCYFPALHQGTQGIRRVWLYTEEGEELPALESVTLTLEVENSNFDTIVNETVTVELKALCQ